MMPMLCPPEQVVTIDEPVVAQALCRDPSASRERPDPIGAQSRLARCTSGRNVCYAIYVDDVSHSDAVSSAGTN